MNNRIIVFDGRNLLWRAFSVFSKLNVELPNGRVIPTGGIFGFLSSATLKWRKYGGKAIVAWEGSNNFRHILFPGYKKRDEADLLKKKLDKEVLSQEKRLMKILCSMGVEQYRAVNGEADDTLATLAVKHVKKNNDNNAIIYTGDSDLRQMVGDRVVVISPGNGGKDVEYVTESDVVKKDLVSPSSIPDLKALSGDTSDKIPGINGVGPVTAFKLLDSYGDIDGVINAAHALGGDWPVSERFREVIKESTHDLKLYKILATVDRHDDVELIEPKRNKKKMLGYLRRYRFVSLMDPLELQSLTKMGLDDE